MTIIENLPAVNMNLLPAAQEFQMFQTIAKSAKSSGLYGGDENKIFMVMLAARELGIPPMLALNGGIWNIQGKIEISARLMNSMIRRGGHTMKITSTAKECVIIGKRCDTGEQHVETFTMEMAEKAGLAGGNVWKKYPEDMLYNRCMSRLARRLFPDVIGTAYVEGEIREAKESEKQELQQVQYEDVTFNYNHFEEPKERSVITQKQLDLFLDTCKLADPECIKNMDTLLKQHYNISSYDQMCEESFERCISWLSRNIDLKKSKAINENITL
jgi:RecT family